jgi:glycine/serine hydroxymethyltransferase
MKEKEMEIVAGFIDEALKNPSDDNLEDIKEEVKEFTKDYPIPGI